MYIRLTAQASADSPTDAPDKGASIMNEAQRTGIDAEIPPYLPILLSSPPPPPAFVPVFLILPAVGAGA